MAAQNNSKPNAFPWTDGDKLSKVLINPELWGGFISEKNVGKEYLRGRRVIKKIIKRYFRSNSPISIENDLSFGRALAGLMDSKAGRGALKSHFLEETLIKDKDYQRMLAQCVFDYSRKPDAWPVEEFCEKREEGKVEKWFLNVKKFTEWQANEESYSETRLEKFAVMVCSFAVLQPEIRGPFFKYLVESHPDVIHLIQRSETKKTSRPKSRDSDKTERPPSPETINDTTNKKSKVAITQPSNPQSPSETDLDSTEFAGIVAGWEIDEGECTIQQLKNIHAILTARLREVTEHLARATDLKKYANESLSKLLDLDDIETTLKPSDIRPSVDEQSLASAFETLNEVSNKVSGIQRSIVSRREMLTRLGRATPPIVFDSLDQLESKVDSEFPRLREEVDRVGKFEKEVASIFDNFLEKAIQDRPEELLYLESKELDQIGTVIFGGAPSLQKIESFEKVRGDFRLVGLLAAQFAQVDFPNSIKFIDKAMGAAGEDRVKVQETLAYLSFDQLHALIEAYPVWLPTVCELTLASAIKANDFERLKELGRFLHRQPTFQSPSGVVYEELANAASTYESLDLRTTLKTAKVKAENPEQFKKRLLTTIDEPTASGHGPLFHSLQEIAREEFLQPLREGIFKSDPRKAIAVWESQGSMDSRIEHCVSKLRGQEKRNIESRHKKNTSHFLASFEKTLHLFDRATRSKHASNNSLEAALEKFKSKHRHRDKDAARLHELISGDPNNDGIIWPATDFGFRCRDGELTTDSIDRITPDSFNAWMAKCEGEPAMIRLLLADRLSQVLGDLNSEVDSETIGRFLELEKYSIARKAAAHDKDLASLVNSTLAAKKSQLLDSEILAEAKLIRAENDDINEYLEFFHRSLDADEFQDAEDSLKELRQVLEHHRFLADPTNSLLHQFLVAYGIGSPPHSTVEMQVLVDKAKRDCGDRRFHIAAMEETESRLPESLVSPWIATRKTIDSPTYWPASDDGALVLSGWIEYFEKYILKKVNSETTEGENFAKRLSSWFLHNLKLATKDLPRPRISIFDELKNGKEKEFWEEKDVWNFVALPESEEEKATVQITPQFETPIVVIPAIPTEPPSSKQYIELAISEEEEREEKIRKVLSKVRREIAPFLSMEEPGEGEQKQILRFCKQGNWRQVRRHVVSEDFDNEADSEEARDRQLLYAISLAATIDSSDSSFQRILENGCSALTCLHFLGDGYYLKEKDTQSLLLLLMAKSFGRTPDDKGDSREYLIEFLDHLVDARRGDLRRSFYERVLRSCRSIMAEKSDDRGDFAVNYWIWNCCSGKGSLDARANLLLFNYRLNSFDSLAFLAKKYTSGLSSPIMQCLEAFNQGESNDAAVEEARRLKHNIFDRAHGERIGPWKTLISILDKAPKEIANSEPLRVETESISLDQDHLVINLQLIPSPYDWPEELTLEIGTEDEFKVGKIDLLKGVTLTKPQMKVLKLAVSDIPSEGEFIRIPFEIFGQSERTSEINFRGNWEFNNLNSAIVKRFGLDSLITYWPGADGKDVKSEAMHHGRDDALKKVTSALSGNDGYQRSLLIIGQRRIGKTSLLNQVVNSYPPRPGACCAVFADVSGFSRRQPSLSSALFGKIVEQIEFEPAEKNLAVLNKFQSSGQRLNRILKDVQSSNSISSALEGKAQVLKRVTNGQIDRIAICLDEFHSIFSWHDQQEVKDLMWDLRQIVQGSKRVSLLMAGSGLTRRLVDSYDQALFGSIETLELHPFSMESEAEAIGKTFLPKQIRAEFAPSKDDYDSLLTRAYELTGGHPWYLSILGSSMASLFGLTRCTPAMLSHVADELVAGRVKREDKEYNSSYFYGHLIQSLNVLGEKESSIAQLVLVNVARNTTSDYQWLRERRILDDEILARFSSRRERVDAIKTLCREQVLEKESSARNPRYRIRVPLVASALKRDATELEDDATTKIQSLP